MYIHGKIIQKHSKTTFSVSTCAKIEKKRRYFFAEKCDLLIHVFQEALLRNTENYV